MSQNHSGNYMDYMDGVPVKISEKYKPPPIISLPYGVIESTSRSAEAVESISYDFSLENNVLKKLVEWQNARETAKNERKHRLQLMEEAKQREQDLKAATENEERLKQLSISEVSYPSTEEISEMSPDAAEDSKPGEGLSSDQSTPTSQQVTTEAHTDTFSENTLTYGSCMAGVYPSSKYLENSNSGGGATILKPTPVSPQRGAPLNLLDDPDPIRQFQQTITNQTQQKLSYLRPSYMKNNVDNLTFSDFENDTSSPFDNMELKTINDLELLAQVLNSDQTLVHHANQEDSFGKQSSGNPSNGLTAPHTYSNPHSTNADTLYSPKNSYATNCQDVGTTMLPYSFTSGPMTMQNGYYDSSGGKLSSYSNPGMANTGAYYASDYGYTNTMYQQQQLPNISGYNQISDKIISHNGQSDQNLDIGNNKYQRDGSNPFTQPVNNPYEFYHNYPIYPLQFTTYSPPMDTNVIQPMVPKVDISEPRKSIGSRSRSVPDIVRELDEEVAEARQRARERSHNCSPALQPAACSTPAPTVEDLPNPFTDLPMNQQLMCKHISAMGFPLHRVARACDKIGVDDKKIVEYLLVMGQLMDLGFPESKVGEALLKNNCNRDKALDDLIS